MANGKYPSYVVMSFSVGVISVMTSLGGREVRRVL